MARTSRAEWQQRVERWGDSGLSAKEFASQTGLKASTLSYWKWRLGSEQCASTPETTMHKGERSSASKRSTPGGSSAPRFVELTPVDAPSTEPLTLVKDEPRDPPSDGGNNTDVDFRGQKRSNDTHTSTTDPEAKLMRKGAARKPSFVSRRIR